MRTEQAVAGLGGVPWSMRSQSANHKKGVAGAACASRQGRWREEGGKKGRPLQRVLQQARCGREAAPDAWRHEKRPEPPLPRQHAAVSGGRMRRPRRKALVVGKTSSLSSAQRSAYRYHPVTSGLPTAIILSPAVCLPLSPYHQRSAYRFLPHTPLQHQQRLNFDNVKSC